MSENQDIIVIKDVHKHFGSVKALNGVSTTVKQGSVVVVIGPSGGGKSTMLKQMIGLYHPYAGKIFIEGHGTTITIYVFNYI